MSHQLVYRGEAFSSEQIARAEDGMGYLIWIKLPEKGFGEYLNDRRLEQRLAADLSQAGSGYEKQLYETKERVLADIRALRKRQIRRVRLGVSWAEGATPGGWAWIKWYLERFHEAGFDILPNINYTPHSFAKCWLEKKRESVGDVEDLEYLNSLRPATNVPPEPLEGLAEYVDQVISQCGHLFGPYVEIWNECDIDTDWNRRLDPTLECQVRMITLASRRARELGKKVVLGGPSRLDKDWLNTVGKLGLFQEIDICGLHGLRGTWSDRQALPSWQERVAFLQSVMEKYTGRQIPVWITEAGFTTVDPPNRVPYGELLEIQAAVFADLALLVAEGVVERVYWYTLCDLVHKSVRFQTTGWEDILQFYFGDIDTRGGRKLLARLLTNGGVRAVLDYVETHSSWAKAYHIVDHGEPRDFASPEAVKQVLERMERLASQEQEEALTSFARCT